METKYNNLKSFLRLIMRNVKNSSTNYYQYSSGQHLVFFFLKTFENIPTDDKLKIYKYLQNDILNLMFECLSESSKKLKLIYSEKKFKNDFIKSYNHENVKQININDFKAKNINDFFIELIRKNYLIVNENLILYPIDYLFKWKILDYKLYSNAYIMYFRKIIDFINK
mgnify:CR=1 FL=1